MRRRRCHKSKAGKAMTRTRLNPEDLQNIRELAAGWGKIVARRAFGLFIGGPRSCG